MRLVITTDTGRQAFENVLSFFSDNKTACVLTKELTHIDTARIVTIVMEYPPERKKHQPATYTEGSRGPNFNEK